MMQLKIDFLYEVASPTSKRISGLILLRHSLQLMNR